MSDAMGRLFIRLQSVVPELDFHSEKERDEFLEDYSKFLPESLRQQTLTWQANKRIRDAQPEPPPKPVPDHIQRERERTAAKQRST